MEIERVRVHLQRTVRLFRPFVFWTIPVELDTVVIRVAQIERFAHAMIAGALERDLRDDKPAEGVGEEFAGRIKNGRMVKAGGAGRGDAGAYRGYLRRSERQR